MSIFAPAPELTIQKVPLPADINEQPLEERIITALKTVYDPEIPVNIWELGLVYKHELVDGRKAVVEMTVTAPACPVAGQMPGAVEERLLEVDGIEAAEVTLVWDPPWHKDLMSDEAKLTLNMFD